QEVRFEGIARDGRLLPRVKAVQGSPGSTAQTAWQERLGAWRAPLERLIGAFLAGDAAVDPKPGACTYCHVTDICRIGERARAAAEEGADEGDAERDAHHRRHARARGGARPASLDPAAGAGGLRENRGADAALPAP